MCTNPVLVPISLVSQFLANEKMASRHWLQCQMECLLDQVFDQLSTKFEDYLANNAITGTAQNTTIHSGVIQHQQRHEPSFQVHSHPQFQATNDRFINSEMPVTFEQSQNGGQMMNINGQVNPNRIYSEAHMLDQPQYPHSSFVPTSNLKDSDQNDQHGLDGDDGHTRNENIDDDAARKDRDEMGVKEEIDDSHHELFQINQAQYPHSSCILSSNLEQTNQNDDEDGYEYQPPIDDSSHVDSYQIEVKEEIDYTNNELITTDQNSQTAIPKFDSFSNEQSNHNWAEENDDQCDLDGTRDDEQPSGLEYGDIDDDAQMDCDKVEVKEEIGDTNNELTNELQQNPALLPAPIPNVDPSNENDNGNDDGLDDQQQNEHLRDDKDEMNEHNEERSRPRKKRRLETTQPNNRPPRVTTHSMRLVNRNQTDQGQHINEPSNSDGRQSNEQIEPTEEVDETNEVDNQDKRIIALRVQCHQSGCPLMFNNKTELNAHMRTQHGILLYRCLVKDCKQSFCNQHNLRDHINQVHSNTTQLHCDKCPKQFSTNPLLAMHNYYYHQLGHYQCAVPNCTFTDMLRVTVFNHYRQHIPTVDLICQHPNCGRRFNNSSNFKRHQRAHLGIRPYRCKWPACGYAAAQKPNTITHIRRNHLKQGSTETSQVDPRQYLEVVG